MATKLYLRSTAADLGGNFREASTTSGSSATQRDTTVTAGASEVQLTNGAGGSVLEWISGYASAGFTLSGQLEFRVRIREAPGATNAGVRAKLWRRTPGGTETLIGTFDRSGEISTSTTNYTWNDTPASGVAFAIDDRLVIRLYGYPQGGSMGNGTIEFTHDANAGSNGESYAQIDETVTFTATSNLREGTLAKTLAGATAAATGELQIGGAVAKTLAAATVAATGVSTIAGSLARTLANATTTAAGGLAITGALARTLAAATVAAAGDPLVAGSVARTLAAATAAATGELAIAGTAAATLDDATVAADGDVEEEIEGAAAIVTADAAVAATGELAIGGAAAITGEGAVLSAAGDLGAIDGAAAIAAADATLGATAALALSGAAAVTVADAQAAAAGELAIAGDAAAGLDDVAVAAEGLFAAGGEVDGTAEDVTVAAVGDLGAIDGAADIVAGDVALAAAGSLPLAGAVDATADDATVAASGDLALAGEAAPVLADAAVAASGTAEWRAAATLAVADVDVSAVGALALEGAAALSIEDAAVAASGDLALAGAAAPATDDVALAAEGIAETRGAVAAPIADLTLAAAGALALEGVGAPAVAAVTVAAAGAVAIAGEAAPTLADATAAAAGTATTLGAVAAALAAVSLAATGAPASQGQAAMTLAWVTVAAAGGPLLVATTARTLAGATVQAAALILPQAGTLLPPVPAPGDLAALFADPQAELEWVAIVEPWDAEDEAIVPLRWSARGMTTDPDADLPDTTLPARLQDFRFRREGWQGLDVFGASGAGQGVLTVDAAPKEGADAGLGHLATEMTGGGARRWNFRRRAARVLLGHPRWSWDDLVRVWTGTVADMTLDDDRLAFQLRDATERLDRDLQQDAFTGDRVLLDSASSVAVDVGAQSFVLPDLVTNGGFASNLSGWAAGSGWAQSSGVAAKSAGTAAALTQDIATAAGQEYTCRFTVARTAGTLTFQVAGAAVGDAIAAAGTYSRTFRATGSTTRIGFAADAAFAGSVDGVTCRLEPRAVAGDQVRIARTSALTTTWMAGEVVSWTESTGTLAVAIAQAAGSGTHSDWSIWLRPYAGTAELAGRPKPVALGLVRYAPPVELGSVQGLWAHFLADRPVRCDPALGHGVWDGGAALTVVGQFPPGAGEAYVDGAAGVLWVYSRPEYPLTATFEGVAEAASTAAQETAAVDFDGTDDYYERTDPFDGAPISPIGSAVIEFRTDGGSGGRGLFHIQAPAAGGGLQIFLDAQHELIFYFATGTYDPVGGYTPGGTWRCESTATFGASANWRRVVASWDLTVPEFTLKVDGVADTIKGTPVGTLRDIVPRGLFSRVGAVEPVAFSVLPFNGCIARCWVALGQKLDLDDPAVMARITTADGYPADLGGAGQRLTGTPPTYFGRGANLGTNLGTGGDLAAHSSPGAASSVPWAPAYAGTPGAGPATAADLVRAVALRMGFAEGELDAAAFAAFASAAPQRQHVWETESGVTGRQVVDQLLSGVGGLLGVTAAGLLTVGRWDGPALVADHALGDGALTAVRRVPVAPALWRRRLGAERCRRVHGPAEIAIAAPDGVRQFLLREWREGVAEDAAVKTADLAADELFVATGLASRDDAKAEAARQLALLGPTVIAVEVETDLRAVDWREGETVALTASAIDLAGRHLQIVGREPGLADDRVRLTLLG